MRDGQAAGRDGYMPARYGNRVGRENGQESLPNRKRRVRIGKRCSLKWDAEGNGKGNSLEGAVWLAVEVQVRCAGKFLPAVSAASGIFRSGKGTPFPGRKAVFVGRKRFFCEDNGLAFPYRGCFSGRRWPAFPGKPEKRERGKRKRGGKKGQRKGTKRKEAGRSERERRTGEANGRDELPERKEERQAGEEPEKGGRFAGVSVALPERFGREQGGGLCSGSLSGGEDLPVLPVADEAGLQLVCRSSAGQYPVSGGGREAECLYGGLVF